DIDIQRHKFSGHALEALRCLIRKPMLKLDVALIDVAQPCKTFEQRVEVWDLLLWTTRMPEITNCGNFSALLRAHRERPRGRAAEQRDKLATFHLRGHSMTSSAMATSLPGIWRPSALAVVRLMDSSNFVGC